MHHGGDTVAHRALVAPGVERTGASGTAPSSLREFCPRSSTRSPPQLPLSYLLLAVKLAARSTVASFLLMPVAGSRPWEPAGPGNARGWSSCHGVSRDQGTKTTSSNTSRSTEPAWPSHSQSLPSSPGYSRWFSFPGKFCSELLPVFSFLPDCSQRRPGSLLSAPSFSQSQGRQRGENRGSGIHHSHRTRSGRAGHLDTPV